MPTSAVAGSSVTSVVPTWVQVTPSGDSYPVIRDPTRVSLSHRGAGSARAGRLVGEVGLPLDPVLGVTMIAAYAGAGPGPALSVGAMTGPVIMRPAFASGPVSSCFATRATIEPSPGSDWCTSCAWKLRCGPNLFASVVLPLPAR